jgi:hypothetical protein
MTLQEGLGVLVSKNQRRNNNESSSWSGCGKRRRQVQVFLDKSKPFGKRFSMKHTREELHRFIGFLKEIEEMTGQMPMVILAIVACINKLLHWLYALLNRKESFLDLA